MWVWFVNVVKSKQRSGLNFIYYFISTLQRCLQIYSSGPGTSLIQAWEH